jgi:photosystem II stability/assembly factor-like uncharacterized protein
VGTASLFLSFPAAANGRFPLSNQIVFSQTDHNLIVVRTSYGILPSHDNGKTWSFICEDALGLSLSNPTDPPVALTHNNSLIVGLNLGLNVSPDVGCNWNCIGGPLVGQNITDVAVRPDNPSGAVAVTSTTLPTDSAAPLYNSQVFGTSDDGKTWAPLGVALDPSIVVTTVDVSKSDPQRLYASGTHGFGLTRTAHLFVSYDKGQTWVDESLPTNVFDPSVEDSVFIGAIDPGNPDRLYMRSAGLPTGGRSRLTTVDLGPGGATPKFTTARNFDVEAGPLGFTGELLGLALSPDGSKIYIGTKEDGLWMAHTSDLKFTKKKQFHVQCLGTRDNELWACAPAVDGFVVGVSTDEGATFTPKLRLVGDLTGPIACKPNPAGAACGGNANSSQCGAAYDLFCGQETCGAPPDASAEGGTTTRGGGSSSCSCKLALAGRGGAAALGAGLAMLGVALQRRRR